MSRISFMQKFPWGELTNFRQKIIISQLETEDTLMGKAYKLPSADGKTYKPIFCDDEPKLHTIRGSIYLQRFIGREVSFFNWVGVPYKKGSTQEVFHKAILTGYQLFEIKHEGRQFKILIDGVQKYAGQIKVLVHTRTGQMSIELFMLEDQEEFDLNTFAKNDGFRDINHFLEYFHINFKGYLYHWTKLRY